MLFFLLTTWVHGGNVSVSGWFTTLVNYRCGPQRMYRKVTVLTARASLVSLVEC